jgi:hypothetical protein
VTINHALPTLQATRQRFDGGLRAMQEKVSHDLLCLSTPGYQRHELGMHELPRTVRRSPTILFSRNNFHQFCSCHDDSTYFRDLGVQCNYRQRFRAYHDNGDLELVVNDIRSDYNSHNLRSVNRYNRRSIDAVNAINRNNVYTSKRSAVKRNLTSRSSQGTGPEGQDQPQNAARTAEKLSTTEED